MKTIQNHPLYQHLSRQVAFTNDEFSEVVALFSQVNLPKKSILIKEGQSVRHQYFVIKGCLRTFMIDHQGKEHTIQLAIENWWSSDYIAYYKEVPASLNVECLEDSELLRVSKTDLSRLLMKYPFLNEFFRLQLENAFVAFQKRILGNLQLSARERYRSFLNQYPNIEQRVKNYHIASYLGITSESLSRLRRERS